MKGEHVPFEKICELYDGEIPDAGEREALMDHIKGCPECSESYNKMQGMMSLLCSCKCGISHMQYFKSETLIKIKSRKRQKLFFKDLPAMAAAILIFVGIGIVSSVFMSTDETTALSDSRMQPSMNDSEEVINIIRKNNARIVNVSDIFVEGEVSRASFNRLRRDLGFRKVAYRLIENNTDAGTDSKWLQNIEEVGSSNIVNPDIPSAGSFKTGKDVIRFRVFR
jgi:predicted  nucleic acid-binding Zn-ribbon protein